MFENLSARMNKVFRDLSGLGKIAPENIKPALREIRVALLEADVHFKVTKDFLKSVEDRAMGVEVLQSVTPADQFIKIVRDELARTLGDDGRGVQLFADPASLISRAPLPPTRILLCGLQGSGKTSSAAKLGKLLGSSAFVALDLKRPAAVEQLSVLAKEVGADFMPPAFPNDPVASARSARAAVTDRKFVIFDTAGRLQIDAELMTELENVAAVVEAHETILVLDAMTGQEAVKVAEAFQKRLAFTSIMLTKTDGDARGGAALSVRYVTGVPIKWIGVSERPDGIESFHPVRFADRILGMGDVVSLVEKAARTTDVGKMEKMARRMLKGELDLEMFLDQMRELRKMGPMQELLSLMPGGNQLAGMAEGSEHELSRFEAMILATTREERRNPEIIDNSRRRRIALGAGIHPEEVNRMLKKFRQMKKMFGGLSNRGKQKAFSRAGLGGFFGGTGM